MNNVNVELVATVIYSTFFFTIVNLNLNKRV